MHPFLKGLEEAVTIYEIGRPTSTIRTIADDTATPIQAAPVKVLSTVVLVTTITHFGLALLFGTIAHSRFGVQLALVILAVVGLRVDHSLDELQDTWFVQLLLAVLEPPEPPAQRNDSPPGPERCSDPDEGVVDERLDDSEDED